MRTIIRNNYDPHIGDYHERIIQDEAREKTWLFDCDGVYLDITAGRGDVKVVNELGDSETDATSQKLVTDELGKKQDTLVAGDNITIEGNVISAAGGNYTAGYGLTLNDTEFAADTSVLATQTDLAGKQDALSQAQLAAVNSGIDSGKVGQITTNASDIDTIEGKIPSAASAQNQLADKSYVDTADNGLQSQIDAISASSDVKDIVGTKAELNSYDTSTLGDNDIIKVLQDESENDATTYYRWSTSTDSFTLIGEEGPYYTKSQANALLDNKVDKVTGKGLSTNDFTDADVTKLGGIEAGAEVNDIDSISVNGTAVTPDANKNVALTIPEDIKTLTTADYNWPLTGEKTAVHPGFLPTGTYYYDGNVSINAPTTTGTFTLIEKTLITVRKGSTGFDSECSFFAQSSSNSGFSLVKCIYASTGACSQINYIDSITDNLTTNQPSNRRFPLNANQGRVLKDLIDSIAIRGAGAPTTSTAGTVGQLYEDGTNGDLYQLKSIDITVTPNTYNWEEVGGGSGPTVVQTTGTSTTDVISQDAVSQLIFGKNQGSIKTSNISIGNTSGNSNDSYKISIGRDAAANQNGSIAVGNSAKAGGEYGYASTIAIGQNSGAIGGTSQTAIGAGAIYLGTNAGSSSTAGTSENKVRGAIALGTYSEVSQQGEMNIGSTNTSYGYNNSNYRLLTGVYPGQSEHDAATVAQGNTLSTTAPTTTTKGVLGQLYTDTTNMHTYQCTAIDTTDPDNPSYTWTQRW